jgi:hypothetical protein
MNSSPDKCYQLAGDLEEEEFIEPIVEEDEEEISYATKINFSIYKKVVI